MDIVTEQEVEAALERIEEVTPLYAQAKATRMQLKEFQNTLKSRLRRKSSGKTKDERDDYAHTHSEYLEWQDNYKLALEEEEKYRWALDLETPRISVWQTQSRNSRL